MLAGREAEQRRIDQLLLQAVAGRSGVLVLRGDPGIGKTALLDYAAGRAGSMRILRTTGTEAENELGFAGLYSLLHPVADYLDRLPEPQAAALRSALGIRYHEARSGRLAVAAGTHSLLTTVAEDVPLLVLVDDLHWLDPASAEALLFALRRLDRDAVACIVTVRSGTAVPAGLPCLEVTGLDSDAAGSLVESVAGVAPSPEVAQRLHADTGGNALALVELSVTLTAEQLTGATLLEAPLEPGAAIRQRFAVRLNQLSPSSRILLLVAAAAGRCLPAEVHAAAARLGRVDGGTLDGATPDGGTLDEAEAALAAGKGAPLEAAAAWERAAELSATAERRSARLAEAAEAALNGGDLDRTRRLTKTLPDPGQRLPRGKMLGIRGRLDLLTGHMALAHRELAESADLIADADPLIAVELLDQAVSAALEAGMYDEAGRAAERMAELAERSDETARFLADLGYGGLAWQRGEAEHGLSLIYRAVSRLEASPALARRARPVVTRAGLR